MIRFLSLFVFTLFCSALLAQNTGYAGKHFILKTDVLNGRFLGGRNAELEYVFARKFSVSLLFRYANGKYSQKFNNIDEEVIGSGYSGNEARSLNVPEADIKTYSLKLAVKYFFNKIVPAPKGYFFYCSFEKGKATLTDGATLAYINGNYYTSRFYYIIQNPLNNINLKQYELGFGYQEVIWGIFVVEGSFGINTSRFNYDGGDSKKRTSGVARYYGPNLIAFGKENYDVFHGNKPYLGSFGLCAYIKVGLLLF